MRSKNLILLLLLHDLETCNLQLFRVLRTKLGILGHQCHAQIWAKIRSKLHARENAGATLHPNKEINKLKKPQL